FDLVTLPVGQMGMAIFALNLFFAILEFIFGVIFNSTAILSDAVHDTGDAVAIGLAWFFQKFSKRREDKHFS
ncbi:cation transporter, partial [Citrobacter sp. TBCS-11]